MLAELDLAASESALVAAGVCTARGFLAGAQDGDPQLLAAVGMAAPQQLADRVAGLIKDAGLLYDFDQPREALWTCAAVAESVESEGETEAPVHAARTADGGASGAANHEEAVRVDDLVD